MTTNDSKVLADQAPVPSILSPLKHRIQSIVLCVSQHILICVVSTDPDTTPTNSFAAWQQNAFIHSTETKTNL